MSEFESRAEAKGRFKGSSLHFLQEEQFRKAATKQYRQYVAAVAAADPPTPPPMLLLLCAPSCCATSDTLALQARAAAHVGRARLGRGARRAIPCRWRAGSEPARARATGASVRATGSCVNMAWVTQPACPPARRRTLIVSSCHSRLWASAGQSGPSPSLPRFRYRFRAGRCLHRRR